MLKYLLCLTILLGGHQACLSGPILDARPKVDKVVDVVTPEVFEMTVTLTTGEVIKTDKLALTPWGVKKRFSANSVDKVVRVMPKGEDKMRVIPVDQIDSVTVSRIKDLPKPEPAPAPLPPAPKPE